MSTLTEQQIYRKRESGQPIHPDETVSAQRHVVSVLLENHMGALNRVTSMFSARGFNLESVAVGETEDPTISRLTMVTTANSGVIRQVLRQLNRLIDTLKVENLTDSDHVERELCLLKVAYTAENRSAIMDIMNIFRGKVVDISPEHMMFEITGPTQKIMAFMNLLSPYGIIEVARSGRIALSRSGDYRT